MVFKVASKINALFLHQLLQKPDIFIKAYYIFHTFVMEDFPFLGNEDDIITSCGAYLCDAVIESATVEVACYGRPGMLSREYYPESVVSNFVREYICYEPVRKKRFTES